MGTQAGIISTDHHGERRERNQRARTCTPNVTLNPAWRLSCQWGSRIQMEMSQHQRFSEIFNCEDRNATLSSLSNQLPSNSRLWKKKTTISVTRNICRQGCVAALALSTNVWTSWRGLLKKAQRDICALRRGVKPVKASTCKPELAERCVGSHL